MENKFRSNIDYMESRALCNVFSLLVLHLIQAGTKWQVR